MVCSYCCFLVSLSKFVIFFFFFFNDTATTEIYTLSLHDALPIFFSGWRGAAVLHRQPHGEGSALRGSVLACTVAFLRAGGSGRISPLHGSFHDLFHVRRHALADRLCLPVSVPARIRFLESTVAQVGLDVAWLHSLRLLAGLGLVSRGAGPLQLAKRGRFPGVEHTAQLHRIRRALEQKLQFRKPLRPVGPEPVPARTSLCVQRRRLPLAEFHSHPGDHYPWPDRRALAA